MLKDIVQLVANILGVLMLMWGILLYLPVMVLEGWLGTRLQRAQCANQMHKVATRIADDTAQGTALQDAWTTHYPGACPGHAGGQSGYILLEVGLDDETAPLIICRPGNHLQGDFGLIGWRHFSGSDPSVIASYANGVATILHQTNGEALIADLNARGITAIDRHGAVVPIDSPDPTARTSAWAFDPYGSWGQPFFFAALLFLIAFAIRRANRAEQAKIAASESVEPS